MEILSRTSRARDILKIHMAGITKHGEMDLDAVSKLADGFNEPT